MADQLFEESAKNEGWCKLATPSRIPEAGREQKIDPTRPITSWRSAWRSIRYKAARNDEDEIIYPELQTVRFHDLRHTAVTTLAEKGLPEQTIMAQVGHISPQMMKTYSHVRRLALNTAAAGWNHPS